MLVQVAAVVTDDYGRFVRGLRQADFTIFDNGTPGRTSSAKWKRFVDR
jgi:hypothetical protein